MMDKCPYIYRCPFKDSLLAQNTDLIKEYLNTPGVLTTEQFSQAHMRRYCRGDYTECARFKVVDSLGVDNLPKNLLPHEIERAEKILNKLSQY